MFQGGSIYHIIVTKKKYLHDAESNHCFHGTEDLFSGEIFQSDTLAWK